NSAIPGGVSLPILKRRSRMISFRLSEDEYASLMSICEVEGARSISDLARSAVNRLVHKSSESPVENALRALAGRVDTLDLELRRLTVETQDRGAMRQDNGKL